MSNETTPDLFALVTFTGDRLRALRLRRTKGPASSGPSDTPETAPTQSESD